MTLSIVDFLNARLAEDEAAAENASQDPDEGNSWSVGARKREWKQEARIGDDREDLVFDIKDGVCVDFDDLLAYLVRFHPARVLREVAAKRAIAREHGPSGKHTTVWEWEELGRWCPECAAEPCRQIDSCPICGDDDGCRTVRLLAAVYSAHLDYREEWAA